MSWRRKGENQSSFTEVADLYGQSACFSELLKDGETYKLWIRATDIVGHSKVGLTPSLPCHLKTTNKSATFETFKPYCFLFLHWHVKGFSSKRIALRLDVIGPDDKLFAGASVQLSTRKVCRLGQ